jgi:poly-beta-1,6-N-acetyl-D-glucosamine synthase
MMIHPGAIMHDSVSGSHGAYVLLTAAYNEAAFIEKTIDSVQSQTTPPAQWVIVSDGSTDKTDEIIQRRAQLWPVIKPVRRERSGQLGFASKVSALDLAYRSVDVTDYQFIGHADADVEFDEPYFENLISRCLENPKLGLCGGSIYESRNGQFKPRKYNSTASVAGAAQFFRKECYAKIGGLAPLRSGGEDTYAEVKTRMYGWEVQSFTDLRVFHNKSGQPRGMISESIRKGKAAYSIGNHPLFEFLKSIYRLAEPPFIIGSIIRLASYAYAGIRREKRIVSDEFVKFLRREQLNRIKNSVVRGSGMTYI